LSSSSFMEHGKGVPDMGSHLILDFHGVTSVDLNSYEEVHNVLLSAIKKTDCTVCGHQVKTFDPQGLTIVYLLSESHMSIHTWPEHKACAIDFYNCGENSWRNLKLVEESLCDALGWFNCTSTVLLPRGRTTMIHTNDLHDKAEILKGVKLLHREKSPYQEIRVYDTKYMGRILMIDGLVQITEGVGDNFTKDLVGQVIQ